MEIWGLLLLTGALIVYYLSRLDGRLQTISRQLESLGRFLDKKPWD